MLPLAGRPNFAVSCGRFNPIQCPFNIVQPGLHWSASVLFTLYCALQSDLGQGVLTGDVAIPSHFPLFDHGKEWFLPASVVGDLLSD